ncbi:MAG: TolC family protein [Verrucomicrobiota bacterium]
MKTISQDRFVDYMSEALPELISSIMREDTSAVSKGRVSVPQFWALHYIAQKEGLTVNELATALHRGKSSTSGLLQRLEKSGLVKRTHSESDRRVVHIALTAKGRKLTEQLVVNRKQGIRKTYGSLTAPERARHMQMLEKILKATRTTLSIVLLAALLPLCTLAQETNTTYTLDESIRLGLTRSLGVVNAARRREIAKATKKRAVAGAWPQITGTADYSLYDAEDLLESGSSRVGAEASWQIFSGGRTISAIRAAKAYKQLTAHQERRIRETQVRDITLSYYQVQLAKARVAVRRQSVEQLSGFEEEARTKHEAGTVSEFDKLSAQVALANENPYLIAAENELALAMEQFRNLTYIDAERFALSDPLEYVHFKIGLNEAIALGMGKCPDLQEKTSAVALRKEDISQQKSDYAPRISLFANYNMYDPDPNNAFAPFFPGLEPNEGWTPHWSGGIRANWNLFDGGTRRANVGESKLNMAIEEDELRDLERAVALDIRTQWLRGRDAAEVIKATEKTEGLAERALEIANARFAAELSTHLEVTQANLELSDARLARSRALYEYMAAITSMKHAMGILLEEYE